MTSRYRLSAGRAARYEQIRREALRMAEDEHGVTQAELAEWVECDQSTASRVLNGPGFRRFRIAPESRGQHNAGGIFAYELDGGRDERAGP